MRECENIFDEFLNLSVKFRNIFIPGRSLQSLLGKYCLNLCVWTHDETYILRLIGTAIPLSYQGRYLLVCTRHQIKNVDPEDVCLLYPDGSLAVTCSGTRFFAPGEMDDHTDAHDIAAFDFTEPCMEHPVLRPKFLTFSDVPADVSSDQILALVVAGFPSADQEYELEAENRLGTVKRNLIALPLEQPLDPATLAGRFVQALDFDPDGLSGSPVFVVQMNAGIPHAHLAGMILTSGVERFRFLKVGVLKAVLDSFVVGQQQ